VSYDVAGQSYALTVLTPIVAGQESALQSHLRGLRRSPFADAPRTHFARWVIVPQPAYQGPPMRPDPWKSQYLIFSACLDGELDSYLAELCELIGPDVDAVWRHCVGYPGSADPAAFARYMHHNRIPTEVYFAAYPDATVAQVREALARRDEVVNFAVAVQGLGNDDLHRRWKEQFGG